MQVLPSAQVVGPVQPVPPHWPYFVCVGPGAVDVVVLVVVVVVVVDVGVVVGPVVVPLPLPMAVVILPLSM